MNTSPFCWHGSSVILASGSPRRKELFELAGIPFEIEVPEVDESPYDGEGPRDLVCRLALAKAAAVANLRTDRWVLGADTIVVVDRETILGKPESNADAVRMLESLQGGSHEVLGGVAFIHRDKGVEETLLFSTTVTLLEMDEEIIERYVATGEPLDKAGAYGVQGVASQFVRAVEGSYANVVGLDLSAVVLKLRELAVIS